MCLGPARGGGSSYHDIPSLLSFFRLLSFPDHTQHEPFPLFLYHYFMNPLYLQHASSAKDLAFSPGSFPAYCMTFIHFISLRIPILS